ncbi:hypothetical protein CL622_08685 [archaeon]|mgnify:CR=1 FL=1|nr:hypothetical protein [archaeon]
MDLKPTPEQDRMLRQYIRALNQGLTETQVNKNWPEITACSSNAFSLIQSRQNNLSIFYPGETFEFRELASLLR